MNPSHRISSLISRKFGIHNQEFADWLKLAEYIDL